MREGWIGIGGSKYKIVFFFFATGGSNCLALKMEGTKKKTALGRLEVPFFNHK